MNTWIRSVAAALSFSAVLSGIALGQTLAEPPKTARISGRVTDAGGGAIADAEVRIAPAESGNSPSATRTDNDGHFVVGAIGSKQYQLDVKARGFKTLHRTTQGGFASTVEVGDVVLEVAPIIDRLPIDDSADASLEFKLPEPVASPVTTTLQPIAAGTVDDPIPSTLCELETNPERYNHKIVSVRDRVEIAFENFALSASDCPGRKLDSIWLEYGKGPKKQPTIWCCGDMVPRDPLVLVQNVEFRRFHQYLTAEKHVRGCYNCYLYQVTASLTGRFDAAKTESCPGNAGERCCPSSGFGHFSLACARLVIQSVSDAVPRPVDPSIFEKSK